MKIEFQWRDISRHLGDMYEEKRIVKVKIEIQIIFRYSLIECNPSDVTKFLLQIEYFINLMKFAYFLHIREHISCVQQYFYFCGFIFFSTSVICCIEKFIRVQFSTWKHENSHVIRLLLCWKFKNSYEFWI